MKRFLTGILLVAGLFLASCADKPLENAFDNDYEPEKNNRIIYEYCVRCHTHKDLDAQYHITSMTIKYSDAKYSSAKECRICHDYSKDFLMENEHRKTKKP